MHILLSLISKHISLICVRVLSGPRTSCPKYPCAYNISNPMISVSLSTIKLVSKEHPYIPNRYTSLSADPLLAVVSTRQHIHADMVISCVARSHQDHDSDVCVSLSLVRACD